ncbi:nucleotidyl transferase AbiEii/AbiGii toxin family protein [Methylobacterium sp. J-090]|uniref:nucleotidyl transferase AbiEii/AbiGii toxin family protein n=1 Tax=Methylobacterium sp. J-090 TaxID=2836666 RepID=UPI001FBB13A9|nr:nucleotidyl transferase AbiEii/AbiGii toxin family protein [Methylobacterium sp. J-090]MCJ2081169.1 nucleotidyl transferase AbiEii/AbiGii toxin family protein [Methylobacterium sp. J-090]
MLSPHRANRETWRRLMRSALTIVDSLKDNGYGELDFRFGGGTVLMLRFDHRISKDIDLFFNDAQALNYLSPRLNDTAARISQDYNESANTIKIVSTIGDIDFIVAGPVIRGAETTVLCFEDRTLVLDPVSEILAKKILYRATLFKPRDVFDMATALICDPPSAMAALQATRHVHGNLLQRLKDLSKLPADTLFGDLVTCDGGERFGDGMIERLVQAVSESGLEPDRP